MRVTVTNTARHRNGISGTPFHVVLFHDHDNDGDRKVAILFPETGHCAVLDVARLAAGDIAFGSNSWRGDVYEPSLRGSISRFEAASNDVEA